MDLYKLNKYQTPITEELQKSLPKEVWEDLIDFIGTIKFIQNLIAAEGVRGFAKDRPRDKNGKIVVDLTNPHILEDMDFFRERAIFFEKNKCYTHLRPNPNPRSEFAEFWREEKRRWEEGYVRPSDGEWVPGYYYFYLNYSPIWLNEGVDDAVIGKKKAKRIRKFPKVWLGDYLFFHYFDQAIEHGAHAKLLKTRGVGFSYKTAAISPCNMYTKKGLPNFHLASDKTFLEGEKGVYGKVMDVLDWIGSTTPFAKIRLINRLSDMEVQLGNLNEYGIKEGLLSSVYGISLKDNPQKARGVRGPLIHYEEDGLFPNLETAWSINRKAVEDGDNVYGIMFSGGTGGVTGASFAGSEKLFRNPKAYNIYGIPNVFDKNSDGNVECGFFWGAYLNRANCYNETTGEPDIIKALIEVLQDRFLVKYNSSDPLAITQKKAEEPITPAEAVMQTSGTIFPVSDLKEYLADIKMQGVRFWDRHYVGDLVLDKENIKWQLADKYPIRSYQFTGNTDGAIEIFEMPKLGADKLPMKGRYIAGCLTPGEKVMTDIGLISVEDVDYERKLINESGDLVDIKQLLTYDKVDEDIYTLKVSNTFRATTFTKEHPILSCTPKIQYHNQNVCKKFNVPQRERVYDFKYNTVNTLNIGDYIKVPNIYKRINNDIEKYWNPECRIDRIIDNPLLKKDFWWFVGLWLGDGYCRKGNISVSFNSKETKYINKFISVVDTLFDRKCYTRSRNGSTEVSFHNKDVDIFLTKTFGKYAEHKNIPEWVKYISEDLKWGLIAGYLASDGSIVLNKKRVTTEFVSISLSMLEAVQDILFSLNIISSLQKLRNEGIHSINGREFKSKETYSLRISILDTFKLKDFINPNDCHKIEKIDSKPAPVCAEKASLGCFFSKDKDYIYFKVKDIQKNTYTGKVYNFECDTHTFMCHHITTHNCDPYDDDSGTSLGSIFIFDMFTDTIVAEYTGRPKFANDFYETCKRMLLFYDARAMYENNKKGLFTYFSQQGCTYLLAENPKTLKDQEMMRNGNYGNKAYGVHATAEINSYARRLQKYWMLTVAHPNYQDTDEQGNIITSKLNLQLIRSMGYLEEAIAWNSDGNFDRISALGMCMILREEKKQFVDGIMNQNSPTKDIVNNDYFLKNYDNKYKNFSHTEIEKLTDRYFPKS